jgi:uncharacterized protein (DUF433 family)
MGGGVDLVHLVYLACLVQPNKRDRLAGPRAPRFVAHSMATLIFPDARATLQRMNWKDRITIDPEKRGGKPCIRGFRMTVYDVLEYLASGMSEEEILKDFPDLTREDIRACLAFAADRERKLVSIPPS